MNKFNTIKVSDKIERFYIDFSSLESLKKSSGFERLYTVHTQETQDISRLLGFHVAGFCDDHGKGGPSLAAEISGYDYLPSDLILCLMDDKYNFLPLDEGQLESLYLFLTTGKVKAYQSFKKDTLGTFLATYQINPILPNFPVEPKVTVVEGKPNLLLLTYDLYDLTNKQIEAFGEELFYYSDRLIKQYKGDGSSSLSPDGRFYLHNQNIGDKFNIIIEVLPEPYAPSEVGDISKCFSVKGEEEEKEEFDMKEEFFVKDAIEEVLEVDEDSEEFDYFVEMKIDGEWPDSSDSYKLYLNSFAYPYFVEGEKDENTPFKDFLIYKGIDQIHQILTVEVNQKHRRDTYDLKLNEPLEIPFDYVADESRRNATHRKGKATIVFRKLETFKCELPGKLEFKYVFKVKDKIVEEEIKYIEHVNTEVSEDNVINLKDGYSYGLAFLDLTHKVAILYSFETDASSDGDDPLIYYCLDLDKEFIRIDSNIEKHKQQDLIVTIRYIE